MTAPESFGYNFSHFQALLRFAKNGNTKMAEGSDDPEGEESPEWFLPPISSYILSARLNMPELHLALPTIIRTQPSFGVCFLISLTKDEGKKCPTWPH